MLNIVAYILIVLGLIITAVNLPGVWLIFGGILVSAISVKFVGISVPWILLFFFVALIAGFIDNIVVLLGAQKFGASKWGIIGALVGVIVGFLIGNIVGVIFGPFLGAVAFELIFAARNGKGALKAGIGTIVGMVASVFVKMVIAIIMVAVWQILLH
ncbi:DUF456 domain-containing protein [Candidatus Dojkabacteria bacterium]|jgi:hypothetical protein|nr:DUF456 domain-containing protein [Candidatus Dojkabacteria bacterium]